MSQRILLLGSKGFIGTILSKYLNSQGHVVEEFDLLTGHDFRNFEVLEAIITNSKASVLVNAFGLNYAPVKKRSRENTFELLSEFEKDFSLNVVSTFASCQFFISSRSKGSIINFSSIYGLVSPNPQIYDGWEKPIYYGVSKAAIIHITKHLAVHHAPHFRINAIAPGGIQNKEPSNFINKYSSLAPMGRMGRGEELVPIIDMLIDERNEYMTGSVVVVDGGWTAL